MKISFGLNLLLLTALVVAVYKYHIDTTDLEARVSSLQATLQKNDLQVRTTQYRPEQAFGYRVPSYFEELAFDKQFRQAPDCQNTDNDRTWVRCVDARKKALVAWLKRKDNTQ